MLTLSVVIPVYGCNDCLKELTRRLSRSLKSIRGGYEVVLVDDGGDETTWQEIVSLAKSDRHIKGIRLSRNFGQHRAITAGVDQAGGTYLVVMDCDLQDRPEEIPALYREIRKGYDVVFARRTGRQDGPVKRTASHWFHTLFGFLSGLETDPSVGNFSIVSREVADTVRNMREQNRSYLQAVRFAGFEHAYYNVRHDRRYAGKTTYSIPKLFSYAVDSITAYSDKPLKLAISVGFLMTVFSFLAAAAVFFRALVFGIPITGWASLFVSIYFLAGMIFLYFGIFGLYLAKIFDEVKGRPLYIVRETVGLGRREDG